MKIIMRPFSLPDNEYIFLVEQALQLAGYEVVPRKGNVFSSDYIIFNWFENIDSNHPMLEYYKKKISLLLLKLAKKKFVFVLHNKQQHDKTHRYGHKLVCDLLHLSDKIMVLCDESYDVISNYDASIDRSKIFKVVLPNYSTIYPNSVPIVPHSGINFLFVGIVRPYKNVELIIECFKKLNCSIPVTLTIAGNCKEKQYATYLKDLTGGDNRITLDLRYIENSEMEELIAKSDVMVLPFHNESILNSSTIMLSFSNKRTVVAPLVGTLKEYQKFDFFYSYEYESDEEHKAALSDALNRIISDYAENPEILRQKGIEAFECVEKYNSLSVLSEQYRTMFE